MTVEQIKTDARRLTAHMRAKFGRNLSVSDSLEALAASKGYRDWNAYSAFLTAHSHSPEIPDTTQVVGPVKVFEPSLADICDEAIRTGARAVYLTFEDFGSTGVSKTSSLKSLSFLISGRLLPYISPTGRASRVLEASKNHPVGSLHTRLFPNPTPTPGKTEISEGVYGHSSEIGEAAFEWRSVVAEDKGKTVNHVVVHVPAQFVGAVRQAQNCPWEDAVLAAKTGLFVLSGRVGCGEAETFQHLAQRAAELGKKVGYLCAQGSIHPIDIPEGVSVAEYEGIGLEDIRVAGNRLLSMRRISLLVVPECRTREELAWIQELDTRGLVVVTHVHAPSAAGAVARLNAWARNGGLREGFMDWVKSIRQQKLVPAANGIGKQVVVEEIASP